MLETAKEVEMDAEETAQRLVCVDHEDCREVEEMTRFGVASAAGEEDMVATVGGVSRAGPPLPSDCANYAVLEKISVN